ncbi:ABC-type Fe3+-siderophore transport system, permease component [Leptolyngbyaceae cyanobacterium JSC-12]|nr:ABC-type Fe3+-siderophore transport system, permease component [Leptolyngbyaceae cyanobacterium JSC-12]
MTYSRWKWHHPLPRTVWLGVLLAGVGLIFVLSLAIGSVSIPLPDVLTILLGGTPTKPGWRNIIWQFRLPRSLTAMLAGAALAISGLQLQTLFCNPLAGPFVLGISSGASLGVAIVVLASQQLGLFYGDLGIITAACIGAASVALLVIVVARLVQSAIALLVLGLMFGYATGAMVNILLQLSSAQQVQQFVIWTFGSFGGVTWVQLPLLATGVGIGGAIALISTAALNVMLLGEVQAQSLGVNLARLRLLVLLSSSLLAGIVTAFCGPIAFLGVAVPHLCRGMLRTADLRWLLPGVVIVGAGLALVADLLSQILVRSSVLPLNSVTALIGTPILIWVILRK